MSPCNCVCMCLCERQWVTGSVGGSIHEYIWQYSSKWSPLNKIMTWIPEISGYQQISYLTEAFAPFIRHPFSNDVNETKQLHTKSPVGSIGCYLSSVSWRLSVLSYFSLNHSSFLATTGVSFIRCSELQAEISIQISETRTKNIFMY